MHSVSSFDHDMNVLHSVATHHFLVHHSVCIFRSQARSLAMEAGSHSINAGASTTSYDAKPGPSAARPSDAHRPEAHSLASPSATAEGSNADPVLSATFIRTCLLITVVWMLISGLLIMISIFVHLGSSAYLFGGSLLSLIGSSLILFTGYLSGPKHRAVRFT
jgi:hypothetical protein